MPPKPVNLKKGKKSSKTKPLVTNVPDQGDAEKVSRKAKTEHDPLNALKKVRSRRHHRFGAVCIGHFAPAGSIAGAPTLLDSGPSRSLQVFRWLSGHGGLLPGNVRQRAKVGHLLAMATHPANFLSILKIALNLACLIMSVRDFPATSTVMDLLDGAQGSSRWTPYRLPEKEELRQPSPVSDPTCKLKMADVVLWK